MSLCRSWCSLFICCCAISWDVLSWIVSSNAVYWFVYIQAIDHIINSASKTNYMSAGNISVPIVFRGPNGAAAGVGAQHSQVTMQIVLSPKIKLELLKASISTCWAVFCYKYEVICVVLCSVVWLNPRIESPVSIFVWRFTWTSQGCYQGPWPCCFPWKWVAVSKSLFEIELIYVGIIHYALNLLK